MFKLKQFFKEKIRKNENKDKEDKLQEVKK